MKKKILKGIIAVAIFISISAAINYYQYPQYIERRNESLNELVRHSLNGFYHACEFYWEQEGDDKSCTKEVFTETMRGTFDLPGISISGEGTRDNFNASANHKNLQEQIFLIDQDGRITRLE